MADIAINSGEPPQNVASPIFDVRQSVLNYKLHPHSQFSHAQLFRELDCCCIRVGLGSFGVGEGWFARGFGREG